MDDLKHDDEARVYLGLGSNIDPEQNLGFGIRELRDRYGDLVISSVYQSKSLGFDGDDFLNLVVGLDTSVAPQRICKDIETIHNLAGRKRNSDKWAARPLDIDLLLYNDAVIDGPPGVELAAIVGDGGCLPRDAPRNTAAVAADSTAKRLRVRARIELHKGLPLCSGLGSSAASAVAGAMAVAALADVDRVDQPDLLLGDALAGERVASGAIHADNVAPSLFGGAMLIHSPATHPPALLSLPLPDDLWLALAIPQLEIETRAAREALPRRIPLDAAVVAWGRVAGIVAAFYRNDLALLADCLRDDLVEPVRALLIPGLSAVKAEALRAGALACAISGAGPSVFALASSQRTAQAASGAMLAVWSEIGVTASGHAVRPDTDGARRLPIDA